VDDIDQTRESLLAQGYAPGPATASSRTTPDGDRLSWRLADVGDGPMHAYLPFLIQWETPMPPGPADGPVLTGVTVEVPSPAELSSVLLACGLDRVGESEMSGSDAVHLRDGAVDVLRRPGPGRIAELDVVLSGGPDGDVAVDGLMVHRRERPAAEHRARSAHAQHGSRPGR
jgi:hypothetical protein